MVYTNKKNKKETLVSGRYCACVRHEEEAAAPRELGGRLRNALVAREFGGCRAFGASARRAGAKLQGLLSYTLHKTRRRRFPTLPVVVHGMDDQWVADLVEMQPLK